MTHQRRAVATNSNSITLQPVAEVLPSLAAFFSKKVGHDDPPEQALTKEDKDKRDRIMQLYISTCIVPKIGNNLKLSEVWFHYYNIVPAYLHVGESKFGRARAAYAEKGNFNLSHNKTPIVVQRVIPTPTSSNNSNSSTNNNSSSTNNNNNSAIQSVVLRVENTQVKRSKHERYYPDYELVLNHGNVNANASEQVRELCRLLGRDDLNFAPDLFHKMYSQAQQAKKKNAEIVMLFIIIIFLLLQSLFNTQTIKYNIIMFKLRAA